ncbi:MAG: UDP-N-acetylmuramoyl-L-alanyl-D-glutamate--2,6-diaminopimelate ligase [Spirochaetaceae bacterium]|nr:MAG: UDP-N-acetylmuramoyl-L-alanyl-D-glutamate--2,6-diaminopimelate ligase [Spirochaetaceae bacterium]
MPEFALRELTEAIDPIAVMGTQDPAVTAISYDSRSVSSGSLFFAIPGAHTDGHRYIDDAVSRGASAIIHASPLDHYPPETPCVQVADSRVALAQVAHRFFGRPSDHLVLIGVTGTDGKSSTVYYLYQLLRSCGIAAGFFSTVAMDVGDGLEKNRLRQSTPESPEIHAALARMVAAGFTHAVIETTSHGLSPRTARLHGLRFEAAAFTNLSHEHLEFHGTFEQYRDDKMNLFRALCDNDSSFGVVNAADPNSRWFSEVTSRPVLSFARTDGDAPVAGTAGTAGTTAAALIATDCRYHADATECRLVPDGGQPLAVRIPVPAPFNVENVLAAVLVVSRLVKRPPSDLIAAIEALQPVVGRMAPVRGSQPFTVLVDYAHSPGSFEKVFPMFRANTPGRLIAVFGSAGERDVLKRPIQGGIAARYADVLVLTDEDPRGEDSMTILEQIAAGAMAENPSLVHDQTMLLIPDRTEAIAAAVSLAREGDTVVMLGKGHEGNIIYREHAIEWDEQAVAEQQLVRCGYRIS